MGPGVALMKYFMSSPPNRRRLLLAVSHRPPIDRVLIR
jgi:hypothetical protein